MTSTGARRVPDGPVAAAAGIARGIRVFSSPRGAPRYRRATDILVLVPCVFALVLVVGAYPPGRSERALAGWLDSIPSWIDPAGSFFYDLLLLAAVVVAATTLVARRWLVLLQALASLVLAFVIAFVAARVALGEWWNLLDAAVGGSRAPRFPGVRLGEAAAVVLAVSPHLVRPLQRVSRWVLVLGFAGALTVDVAPPSSYVAGLLAAIVAASGIRLAFGTSAGLPRLADVAAALAELRLPVDGLELDERDLAGVVGFRGRDADGRPLVVKVHGRDAYDNQLVEKLWHTLWYRDAGPGLRLSRGQAVEHEALVTLLARSAGVQTFEVVRAGTTTGDDGLLVLRGDARGLGALPRSDDDEAHVEGAWLALGQLHRANLAHRRIDPSAVALVDGEVGFVDLGGATTTPTPDHLMTDRAQLLVTTATLIGTDPALASAQDALGREGLAGLLPYLQEAALQDRLRRATKAAGIDVDVLRADAAALTGEPEPTIARLRRVTWRSLVQTALLLLAALAILSFATGIDYDQFADGLADASWFWIVVGVVAAQLPRLTQSVATLGSVAADLRFGPVYAMQLASGYMNLALPSVAARLAVSIRFFQRQGITAAAAVTSGAIDSFASTVVQVVLLGLLLLFSESTLSFDLDSPSEQAILVALVVLAIVITAVVAVVVLRRARRAIVERVRAWWPEVRVALAALRSSNKLALLLFGTIATEILFAFALGLFALGLGTRVSLPDLLVINIGVALLSTFIPVPGGIGVTELGLTVGLVSAGMSEETALAAVLLYRISVFYVPPVWGFFALRWLQQKQYL
jgi:uncharacterized membrane protein YbhN (UPF0104 family)